MIFDSEQVLQELQNKFDGLMETGSWGMLTHDDLPPLDIGIICFYQVLRVAPHFDASGNNPQTDFWLLFCLTGYEESAFKRYVRKVTKLTETEFGYDLETENSGIPNELIQIERICPPVDEVHERQWQSFQNLLRERPDFIAKLNQSCVDDANGRLEA